MNWISFLGINLIAATVRETVSKKVVNHIDPLTAFFYFSLFISVWLFIIHLIIYKEPPRIEPHDTLADSSLAKKLLGWKPTVALEEGIAELRKVWGLH